MGIYKMGSEIVAEQLAEKWEFTARYISATNGDFALTCLKAT